MDAQPHQHFDYAATGFAIREDLPTAYRSIWQQLSHAGNWFTGQDRIAIASEVRNARACSLCSERAKALSAEAVQGTHDSQSNLPQPVIDAVHRITRDASRLSPTWLEKFYASGYTDGHYIELLGIVVALISIDAFHDALSLPHEPLPSPLAGEPDHYRPPGASDRGAWVPTVAAKALTQPEADIYGGAESAGNVVSAMSLVPDSVRMLMTLGAVQYLSPSLVPNPNSDGGRAISRPQIELLAGRVSSINECFY